MDPIQVLAQVLQVERLEHNWFRGVSTDIGRDQLFGGQVLAQALVAASRTVEGRQAHSLHAYFLRAGDIREPVVYDVERIRDGGTFATRRVVAIQRGRPILNAAISFQAAESGVEHQATMPNVPAPETLQADPNSVERMLARLDDRMREAYECRSPFEILEVHPDLAPGSDGLARHCVWLRPCGKLPAEPLLHQAALLYISDFNLLQTSLLHHDLELGQPNLMVASLDHSMWFHHVAPIDDWVLYVSDSPAASNARGFCRGSLFSREGKLLASVAQEGLVRQISPRH